jgi:hypothetical protein
VGGAWRESWEEKCQRYGAAVQASLLLDFSFGTLESDLMLDAPPDVAYQSMQLNDANCALQGNAG